MQDAVAYKIYEHELLLRAQTEDFDNFGHDTGVQYKMDDFYHYLSLLT